MAEVKQTFHLLNLGCAKNQVEGEHLAGMLLAAGHEARPRAEEAELLLVNTCGFIQPAVEEALGAILGLAREKRPGQRLAVVGCLVGRYGKKLAASLPEVDVFIAPGEVQRLLAHLERPPAGRLAISPPRGLMGGETPRALSTGPGWAWLRVSDGCDHRCAFCAIPHIRGRLRSRRPEGVLDEARRLVAGGARELNLVAQDLCGYGRDLGLENGLTALLAGLDEIEGLAWTRLLYMHPDTLERPLIQAMAASAKCLPYFDLPLQHIADPVLRAMGRRRSGAELREVMAMVRQEIPQAVVRTTLMVGHPGEGEGEFAELLEYVEEYGFDHLGCFAFQPEAGTRSSRLPAPDPKIARRRRRAIMSAQGRISRARLKRLRGRELEILVLGPHPESDLLGLGRLASQAPEVDGEVIITAGAAQPGAIARCRIRKTHTHDLEAELV